MATVCPSCEHIHFVTGGAEPPRTCAKCGGDMFAPPVKLTAAPPQSPTPASASVHMPTVLAGVIALFGGVCLALVGKNKLDEYGSATVTVRVAKVTDKVSDLNLGAVGTVRYTHYRFDTKAHYVAEGRAYPFDLSTVSHRWDWADGETFTTYYRVDAPGTPVKSRSFGLLLCGAATALVGLAVLAFAVFIGNGGELPAAFRPVRRA